MHFYKGVELLYGTSGCPGGAARTRIRSGKDEEGPTGTYLRDITSTQNPLPTVLAARKNMLALLREHGVPLSEEDAESIITYGFVPAGVIASAFIDENIKNNGFVARYMEYSRAMAQQL